MVVLSPLFAGERIRICTQCGCLGIQSPIRERSNYRWERRRSDNRHPSGFMAECRLCEAARSRRQRAALDEATRERRRQDARIRYRLGRERAGVPLPKPKPKFMGGPPEEPYAVGPFRAWVNRLIAAQTRWVGNTELLGPEPLVAARLGVSQRRLYAYRCQTLEIDYDVIDRSCTNEGSIRVEDIYCDTGVFHGPEARP